MVGGCINLHFLLQFYFHFCLYSPLPVHKQLEVFVGFMSLQATPLISTQHLGKSPSVFYGVPVSKYFANEFNYHITTRRKVSRKKDHNNFFKLYLPSPFERCKIIRCLHTPNRVATRQREIVRTLESEGDSASRKRLVFAYYVTGHGFGHATRVAEVVRNLILAGHYVHVVTGAPDFVFTSDIQSPRLFIRKTVLDCGAVQADALSADSVASLEKYTETAVKPRASILATEREWLNFIKADLVVSDVVPVACRAAADAGIRSVCVTNFSWDFIYSDYVKAAGRHHRSIVRQITEDYSHCELLIRLPGYCPMPAFRDVIDAPLVVRRLNKSRKEIRSELGISEEVKLVILNFGGQPAGWKLKEEYLPEGWLCLVCGAYNSEELPPNFIKLVKDAYTPDFIAASDCMLGKIGYGTVSEALAYKVPFIFVRRDNFNEEPFLRDLLEHYQGGVEMIREDFFAGHWKPYLEHAISLQPCYEGGTNGAEVAARILQETAIRKNYASDEIVEVMRRKAKLPTVDRVKGERSKVA